MSKDELKGIVMGDTSKSSFWIAVVIRGIQVAWAIGGVVLAAFALWMVSEGDKRYLQKSNAVETLSTAFVTHQGLDGEMRFLTMHATDFNIHHTIPQLQTAFVTRNEWQDNRDYHSRDLERVYVELRHLRVLLEKQAGK